MTSELTRIKAEIEAGNALAREKEHSARLFGRTLALKRTNSNLRQSLRERDDAVHERNSVIARQRATIERQAKLIGSTPFSQLHLHGDPLMRPLLLDDVVRPWPALPNDEERQQ